MKETGIILSPQKILYLIAEKTGVRVFSAMVLPLDEMKKYYDAYSNKETLGKLIDFDGIFEVSHLKEMNNATYFSRTWNFSMEDIPTPLIEGQLIAFSLVESSSVFLVDTDPTKKEYWYATLKKVAPPINSMFDDFVIRQRKEAKDKFQHFKMLADELYLPVNNKIGDILTKFKDERPLNQSRQVKLYGNIGIIHIQMSSDQKYSLSLSSPSRPKGIKPNLAALMVKMSSPKKIGENQLTNQLNSYQLMLLVEELIAYFDLEYKYGEYSLVDYYLNCYKPIAADIDDESKYEEILTKQKVDFEYLLSWLERLENHFSLYFVNQEEPQ